MEYTFSASQFWEATNPGGPISEAPIEQAPAPGYGNEYGKVDFEHDGFESNAKVASRHLLKHTWYAQLNDVQMMGE